MITDEALEALSAVGACQWCISHQVTINSPDCLSCHPVLLKLRL